MKISEVRWPEGVRSIKEGKVDEDGWKPVAECDRHKSRGGGIVRAYFCSKPSSERIKKKLAVEAYKSAKNADAFKDPKFLLTTKKISDVLAELVSQMNESKRGRKPKAEKPEKKTVHAKDKTVRKVKKEAVAVEAAA